MLSPNPVDRLITWIKSFNPSTLQNEDDVETKFVLPLFQLLGYPENYRRGKYPLKKYNPGKQGRKPEIDQIYFATDKLEQQNADTSLVLIEAKEPQEKKLNEAIEQAKFYGSHLEPVFLIITNGYQIVVLKRRRYRGEEVLFDEPVDSLADKTFAVEFYKQLNFEIVKSINENTANILTHNKYVLLERSLQRHPELLEILNKGDFEPSIVKEGNRLTIVKPKVAIKCNIPKAFEDGECDIEFSSVILRGLTINLNHQHILGGLMAGLNSQPHWGTRRFLRQLDANTFEATLGETTVILSAAEAKDLCLCVDEMGKEYKKSIIEAENILETWDFELTDFEHIRGLKLFSVGDKLWNLMHQFSREFYYSKGKSEWHIFKSHHISIQVGRGINDHAFIWQIPDISYWPCSTNLPNGKVNIVYYTNKIHLEDIQPWKVESWKQDVGPKGTWTAIYTKKWLLEKFIPQVLDYYCQHDEEQQKELKSSIDNPENKRIYIEIIDKPNKLVPYICDIQQWLSIYGCNVDASLFRSYCKSLTDLVSHTNPEISGMGYITEKLLSIQYSNSDKDPDPSSIDWRKWDFQRAINFLYEQVKRIYQSECEDSSNVDLMSSTFIWILENGNINCSQAELNAAKKAVEPLWNLSRFEMRHVYPNR